ncbi:pseudaminic acid cytidylyltransferase [Psychrobacter sp. H8-1]|uniref:pseudaminic acid cytidylyltransferase n=1 Tax=Psychrobacter sp. H8-1 TaxID=2774129 RepID=UPI001918DEAF|nr:pseudaminic acid cytidylyltransferase [Psychrobacter sp. H8-1]
MANIAVIPARGGSKRIPRKNVKEFCGKPIISYSIEAAKKSGCFDKIIVSTDDLEIAEIATKLGAEVPFIRPDDISEDFSVVTDTVIHAITELEKKLDIQVERACLIYATAPLINSRYIVEGLEKLLSMDKSFAIGVTSYAFPIQRALSIINDEISQVSDYRDARSQDLEEYYHDAAHFCWGTKDAFLEKHDFFSSSATPVVIPRGLVQDIDTAEDWKFAEMLYRANNAI